MAAKRVRELGAGALLDAQYLRDRTRHQQRVGDRAELHQPYAVRIGIKGVRGHLQREPSLANSADAHQRQEPASHQQVLDFGELALASDERRKLLRQVVGRCFERAQRRKFLSQLRMHKLVDMLGRRQVLEPHEAQIT